MEPVRIRCQQCSGRLVIRTPELLGKSVHCPRCQSIVNVPVAGDQVRSAMWSENNPVLPPSFDSTAVTRVQDPGNLHLGDPVVNDSDHSVLPSATAKSSFDDDQLFPDLNNIPSELLGSEAFLDLPSATDIESQNFELGGSAARKYSDSNAMPLSDQWVNPSTSKKRLILMVGMTAFVATTLAVILFVSFLKSFNGTRVAKVPLVDQVNAEVTNPKDPALAAKSNDPAQSEPDAASNATKLNSLEEADNPKGSATSIDANTKPVDPKIDTDVSLADPKPSAVGDSPQKPTQKPTQQPTQQLTPPPMANNLVPDLKLEPLAPTTGDEVAPAAVENLAPPPSLAMFAPVFELGGNGFTSDAATTESAPPEFNASGGIVDLGLLTHPAAVFNPPWEDAKLTAVLKLSIDQQPLSQVLLTLGQLCNTGLGWDPKSFRFGNIDLSQKVSISASDSTIDSELNKLIKTLRLEKQIVAQSEGKSELVLLNPNFSDIEGNLPTDWSIDDLATSDDATNQWERLLVVHFPRVENSWSMAGRSIVWKPDSSIIEKANLAAFLDQARNQFGLPMKSGLASISKDDSVESLNHLALVAPLEAYARAAKTLTNTGKSVFGEAMSGPYLLDQAARECGLEVFFDWSSILSHGFSHSATQLSLFRNRTWPQIAKRLLDQFDLVAVIDGPKRILVTTLAQQRQRAVSTIIPRLPNETLESIGDAFRILSPTDQNGRSTLVVSPLPKIDPKSEVEYVVVKHCLPNTKQLELLEVRRALRIADRKPE